MIKATIAFVGSIGALVFCLFPYPEWFASQL